MAKVWPYDRPVPQELLSKIFARTVTGAGCWFFKPAYDVGEIKRYPTIGWEGDHYKVAVILMVASGEARKGSFACHTCNNIRCVRWGEGHIYAGSTISNADDRTLAGTSKGKGGHLTGEDVLNIRRDMDEWPGVKRARAKALADRYQTSWQRILHIWRRRSWQWL